VLVGAVAATLASEAKLHGVSYIPGHLRRTATERVETATSGLR
jgi:hypothetical protein